MASLNRNPLTELVDDIDYVLHCGSNQPKGFVGYLKQLSLLFLLLGA